MNEERKEDIKIPSSTGIEMPDDLLHPKTDEEKMANRLMRYQYLITRYTRVSEPDKDLLSELVVKAKGPARTMKQFAEEVGTTPSTLSRLVNKQNRGPNSDELIAAIAAHADPESGVTFEQLMGAHGMARKVAQKSPRMVFEEEARKVIINELYTRKYTIVDADTEETASRRRAVITDFSLKTDALHDGTATWGFEAVYSDDDDDSKRRGTFAAINIDRRLTQVMAAFYVGDFHYDKVSIVTSSKRGLDMVKERTLDRLEERKIQDDISIILLDMEKGCFVEEFIIPNESNNNQEVFFPVKKTSSKKGDNEDDENLFGQQSMFPWDY